MILVTDGKADRPTIQCESITEQQLLQAVCYYGLQEVSQVQLAILESDGTISIIPKE